MLSVPRRPTGPRGPVPASQSNKLVVSLRGPGLLPVMADLFSRSDEARGPLPARLRPRRLEDFVGQSEVVARLSETTLQSLILYGPPGCGKTTLAHILS